MFIAVNSGNGNSDVASYLKKNGIAWPTIVDQARMFEKAAGLKEISLNNIRGYRVLNANGAMVNSFGLEASAKLAMSTAKWNVDPEGIPASLKTSWQAIEFGDFVSAARTLQRALKSKNTEIQTAAQTLNEYVQGELADTLEKAAAAKTDGDEWLAFKTYTELQYRFKGYDTGTDVKAELETLADSESVKSQMLASRQLENALKTASRSGIQRAAKRLKKIIKQYPDTEAAQKAQDLLDSAGLK